MLNPPDLHSIQEMTEVINSGLDGWKSVALRYNAIDYNYYDKSPEELKWLQETKDLLFQTCPEQYKIGAHLIGKECAFMGEDVYVFEGHITHNIHVLHKTCGKYSVLNWDRLYCAHCKQDISHKDIEHF